MRAMRFATVGAAVVVVVFAAGLGGYLLGHADAPSSAEAQQARTAAGLVAASSAEDRAFAQSHRQGQKAGYRDGKQEGSRKGASDGTAEGRSAVNQRLATQQREQEGGGLEYVDQLPNGDPGYVLPEDQRTLGCVGYSAITGQCVGD